MKILKLSSSFPRYEGDFFGPWILEYCRELVRQGHEVTLVAPCPGKMDLEHLSEKNLTIKRFNYWLPRSSQKLVYPPGIIPQLKANKLRYFQIAPMLYSYYRTVAKLCKENKYDIIHSQWVIPSGYIGHFLAKKYNIPHVITSQGAEFFLPTDHPFSRFTKQTLSQCDYLFPVSKQMGERALNYGISKDKVVVAPNTVNTEIFNPNIPSNFRKDYNIDKDEYIFLTIRRLVFEKRVEDVIDAFSGVKKTSQKKIRLVIGGDGPDRKQLEERCKKLGLGDSVIFMGFVDNSKLPPIYASCDSYLLSSQQEGLSLSLLESMSSALVTIATRSTGGNELIIEGKNGFLYTVGDIKALEEKMTLALQMTDSESDNLRKATRDTIIQNYSVQKMVQTWNKYYEKLTNEKSI